MVVIMIDNPTYHIILKTCLVELLTARWLSVVDEGRSFRETPLEQQQSVESIREAG